MRFLAPWYIPLAALLATVPPLVLLYFLKLRRRQLPIASTLLWRRAVEDLRVNSPFQRLRSSLLLILQLLVLLLAALAISEPIRGGKADVEQSIVLLIDRSASMAAREEGDRSRLDIAKEHAGRIVDGMSTASRAMIITFADRATVLAPFTDDKQTLRRAIESITQSDAAGRLHEAMQLAEAHSTPVGEDTYTEASDVTWSSFLLLTDGRLPDADQVVVQRGRLEVLRVGEAKDNVGIVDLDVRRHYERPEQVSVLARIRNFGSVPVTTDVSLLVDGRLRDVRTVRDLAPMAGDEQLGSLPRAGMPAEGSDTAVTFDLTFETAAEIEVRLARADDLAIDNRAFAVVGAPRAMSALLVTRGNRYLRNLMAALPLAGYDVWTPDEYENAPADKLIDAGRCRYEVVVFDGHSTERLPPGSYLFFGGVPLIDEVEKGPITNTDIILDWDDTHPVLRHVAVGTLSVFSWHKLQLPVQATTLIEASNGPVLALLQQERHRHLICAFSFFDESRELLNTSWVFDVGLVVFMHNATRYLAGDTAGGRQMPTRPGQAISVPIRPGLTRAVVQRPDGREEEVPVRADGMATYGQTDVTGFYRIPAAQTGQEVRAVSLLDEEESFIAPHMDFHIGGGQVQTGQGTEHLQRPLWPYLLALLGVVLLIEWFVYNKRVFI